MPSECQNQVIFLEGPSRDTLCSVIVKVPPLQNLGNSPYQPHVIRCRELIFTEPNIIATPLYGDDLYIQIIIQQSYFKSGRLQARFNKIGMEMQKPRRVLPSEFQACLNYTIQAKLAPNWNKTGNLLVQGREFMTSTERLDAVYCDLNVTENEMYIAVRGHTIRLPPVRLPDLDISAHVLHEFSARNPEGKIEEYSIYSKWCHILPSMKKGQVISVTQTIPHDSPFRSYKDMKRYWKNMYGYRLPEDETGMLYFQIYFKLVGERLFTYPGCCIRSRDFQYLQRPDSQSITQRFLADLQNKLPSICGTTLHLQSQQARYTDPALVELQDINTWDQQVNLTDQLLQNKPVRQIPSLLMPSQTDVTLAQGQIIQVPPSMRTKSQPAPNDFSSSSQKPRNPLSGSVSINTDMINGSQSHASQVQNSDDVIPPTQPTRVISQSQGPNQKKIIPVFKALKPKCMKVLFRPQRTAPKTVPNFPSKVTQNLPLSSFHSCAPEHNRTPSFAHPSNENLPQTNTQLVGGSSLPSSNFRHGDLRMKQVDSISPQSSEHHVMITNSQLSNGTPKTLKKKNACSASTLAGIQPQSMDGHPKQKSLSLNKKSHYQPGQNMTEHQPQNRFFHPSPRITAVPGTPTITNTDQNVPTTPQTPWGSESHWAGAKGGSSSGYFTQTPNSQGTPRKRLSETPDEMKSKKPRSKPKVQEGLDIAMLARSNQLNNVNTATLASWLKEKGVNCKAKDKKGELMEKVLRFITVVASEH